MSILLDETTRVMVQGLGRDGAFHALQMRDYGTNVVAGVHPGRAEDSESGIPVFNDCRKAVEETGADCSVIFVPARFATDAILEAIDSGVGLVVAVTEGIPVMDMSAIHTRLEATGCSLVGPNCPGLISPGKAKVGIMPGSIFAPGKVGLVSRSGTLTYQVVKHLTGAGLGQSTAVGMGGDPITGLGLVDYLKLFETDEETEAVVLVGEIGGSAEERAAEYVSEKMSKPVVGFIVGRTAPPGKRMGHAGAIISGGSGTAESKVAALRDNGVPVADTTDGIVDLLREQLGGNL